MCCKCGDKHTCNCYMQSPHRLEPLLTGQKMNMFIGKFNIDDRLHNTGQQHYQSSCRSFASLLSCIQRPPVFKTQIFREKLPNNTLQSLYESILLSVDIIKYGNNCSCFFLGIEGDKETVTLGPKAMVNCK